MHLNLGRLSQGVREVNIPVSKLIILFSFPRWQNSWLCLFRLYVRSNCFPYLRVITSRQNTSKWIYSWVTRKKRCSICFITARNYSCGFCKAWRPEWLFNLMYGCITWRKKVMHRLAIYHTIKWIEMVSTLTCHKARTGTNFAIFPSRPTGSTAMDMAELPIRPSSIKWVITSIYEL